MASITAADLAADVGADLGVFAADLNIPIVGLQAQGDLYVIPADRYVLPATRPLRAGGETVVVGRGGNAHVLAGDGVCWEPAADADVQTLGVLTVPTGRVGYLFHAPEHGPRRLAEHAPNAIAPGTYVVRRQREQADEIRAVQD